MSERDTYPAGVPCWVENLQRDPRAGAAFYGALFGWEFDDPGPMPGDPPGEYFVARARGRDVAGIGSLQAAGAPVPVWSTYVRVESADDAAARATQAGGTVMTAPVDAPPAGRLAVIADPAGAVFCVWEGHEREGAQIINEPGAWAMSALQTADPAGAEAFYEAMFGWHTEPFGPPEAGILLWRRPGYVGGEPEQPVPRDVVAVMQASPGAPASRWGVDFWVKDADATAEEAARLGGSVLVAPHEQGSFRNAVIADPDGAVLSISQLMYQ